jgi:hypothetical protein
MTRRSLRFLFLVAAIGSATSVVLDLSSHQAMAASTIDLDTGVGHASYTLGYLTNTTVTSTTDPLVGAIALANGTSPALTVAGLTPANVTNPTAAAIGWVVPAVGNWIAPNSVGTALGTTLDQPAFFTAGFSGAQGSSPQGFYYYATTFALTPGAYALTGGLWASDNQGVQAILNGAFVIPPVTNNGFGSFAPLSITSGFNTAGAGLNTLTFVIWNENYATPVPPGIHGSPSGLDIQATVTAVPEPAAIAVVVSGLPLIGLFWAARRRRRVSV